MLAVVISTYGFAVASFALLQGLSPNGKLYWIRTPRFGGGSTGPYVNHNHYAGLMEMLVPVPLEFCMTRYAKSRVRTLAAGAAAVMAATIFFSGSRGGMLAFIVECIVLGTIIVKMRRGVKVAASIGVFAAVVVGLLIWIGGVELTKRVGTIGTETRRELSGGLRWTVNKDGLRMFASKPVLGWGLGTFPTAYPQFRTFYTNSSSTKRTMTICNCWLKPARWVSAIMLWFLFRLYRGAVKRVGDWPNDLNGAMTLACLLGCTGILVHSFVDFNLQIPANAALFFVLCVLAASPYQLEARQRVRKARSLHSRYPEVQPAAEPAPDTADPSTSL